jgi:SAM-dependent methyltransferase
VFLDFSEPMLAVARARLRGSATERFVLQDYSRTGWTLPLAGFRPFDVVVSGFSIHHQPDEKKRVLYCDVFDLLRPGGLFLNLEHVASNSAWGSARHDDHFLDALWEFHQRSGRGTSREQLAREYLHRADKAANILASVEDQCRWLREIGFADVDTWFKVFELALFGGRKPAA